MVIEDWKKCGIATVFPTYRNGGLVTSHSWLLGKQADDEAEGLWRIHDGLYDLTDFVDKHPGGSFWLRETKGTDITEAFESHHLSLGPQRLLEKYKIRDAAKPRIYTLTLNENGFFKTLQSRVRAKLKTMDVKPMQRKSDTIHFILLISIFLMAWLSLRYESLVLMLLASLSLTWTAIVAHNYFHQKDNWQMYTFNLTMLNVNSWRVSHALSHHIYPNSYFDVELALFEPFLCWVPNPVLKSKVFRYISWLTEPITYTFAFFLQVICRIIYSLQVKNIMYKHDLIALAIPVFLILTSGNSLWLCVVQWLKITILSSFIFCVIGLNAAHHDPEIYHEGDKNREDRDWGLFQVDTIMERTGVRNNILVTLTHFGDHALHHLFPTLDHAILPAFYPILYETLNEFKGELRHQTFVEHLIGQHKQLIRTTPNPIAPGEDKRL